MLSDGRLAPSAVVNVWINTQAMLWWAVFNFFFFLIKNLRLIKLMAQSYMHLKIVTKTMQTYLYLATKLNPSQAESMRQARVWIICPIREHRTDAEQGRRHSLIPVMSLRNAHEYHGDDDDDSNCKLTFALSAEYLCGFPKDLKFSKQISDVL